MEQVEIRRFALAGFASFMLSASAGWAHDDHEGVRFQATLQTTSLLMLPPVEQGRCADLPTPLVGLLKVVGAGDTNLVGVVKDEQSHCVRADGTFDGGKFTLTNPQGKKIEGRYFGGLVPTFNSKFPPPAPLGTWLIAGSVCIVSLGGRPVSDCSHPPANYEPATGITDLSTGAGTIFLDQFIRFK